MRAVSIKQPWASLIATGEKTLEIRQWPTRHRGPLLICSSRRPVIENHLHGRALCIVQLIGCRRMTPADLPFACIDEMYPGYFAWELGAITLIKPFEVMGQLRLFEVPDELVIASTRKATVELPRT